MANSKSSSRLPSDEVSYGKDELDLYMRVQMRCKHESKAGFYKKAVLEKLERESNPMLTQQYTIPMTAESYIPINQDGLDNLLDSFME